MLSILIMLKYLPSISATRHSALLLVAALLLVSQPANSQELKNKYKDWSVYTINENGQKLCYAVSYPKRKTGNYRSRSQPYAMVTTANGKEDEFSVTGGYKYKERTEPRIKIDRKTYRLSLTKGEMAWPKTDKFDRILVDKMKKGSTMKVTGTSQIGTYSIDTYSLSGFTKAHRRIRGLCL